MGLGVDEAALRRAAKTQNGAEEIIDYLSKTNPSDAMSNTGIERHMDHAVIKAVKTNWNGNINRKNLAKQVYDHVEFHKETRNSKPFMGYFNGAYKNVQKSSTAAGAA